MVAAVGGAVMVPIAGADGAAYQFSVPSTARTGVDSTDIETNYMHPLVADRDRVWAGWVAPDGSATGVAYSPDLGTTWPAQIPLGGAPGSTVPSVPTLARGPGVIAAGWITEDAAGVSSIHVAVLPDGAEAFTEIAPPAVMSTLNAVPSCQSLGVGPDGTVWLAYDLAGRATVLRVSSGAMQPIDLGPGESTALTVLAGGAVAVADEVPSTETPQLFVSSGSGFARRSLTGLGPDAGVTELSLATDAGGTLYLADVVNPRFSNPTLHLYASTDEGSTVSPGWTYSTGSSSVVDLIPSIGGGGPGQVSVAWDELTSFPPTRAMARSRAPAAGAGSPSTERVAASGDAGQTMSSAVTLGTNRAVVLAHRAGTASDVLVASVTSDSGTGTLQVVCGSPAAAGCGRLDGPAGLWAVGSDGGMFAFGRPFFGSMGGVALAGPVTNAAATPSGGGYWLVGGDGGVFAFGDAGFFGSAAGLHLAAPVTAIASTPDGRGYWMLGRDGGVFGFGDAPYVGSTGASPPPSPAVALVPTASGQGYWLVTAAGDVIAFGDAAATTGVANLALAAPIVAARRPPFGRGLWLVGHDGGVFALGGAPFYGAGGTPAAVGLVPFTGGGGYWLVGAGGAVTPFGAAPPVGDGTAFRLHGPWVAAGG